MSEPSECYSVDSGSREGDMSRQQLAQKQYDQAKEAAEKLEDWRLKEIRFEMQIGLSGTGKSSGNTPKNILPKD